MNLRFYTIIRFRVYFIEFLFQMLAFNRKQHINRLCFSFNSVVFIIVYLLVSFAKKAYAHNYEKKNPKNQAWMVHHQLQTKSTLFSSFFVKICCFYLCRNWKRKKMIVIARCLCVVVVVVVFIWFILKT